MAELTNLHIGGVPEHFNYPWYLALKDKAFHKKGINLRWRDYYGGTGAMCQALRQGEIDLAVILTEGIVRDIVQGNPTYIVQVFVGSPLLWGIHVARGSSFTTKESLKGSRAAISRYGSGSHLMAYVLAEEMGWSIEDDLRFEVIHNLEGALKALPAGSADYFLWEKFTTKPYVDSGIFRFLGVCPTPWPCFVIAVRKEVWETQGEKIKDLLTVINTYTDGFHLSPGMDAQLSLRYGQQLQDIREWLSATRWSSSQLSRSQLKDVQDKLLELNLIDQVEPPELFFPENF